ncbi:MAG TPA: HAMP domain-containing sensor histidine kinase [Polyangia bacterium]|nr:HAMP domain-containing sensor histidine kinase [Polyangia bacterium]
MPTTWTLPGKAVVIAGGCSATAVLVQKLLLARVHSELGVWLVLATPFACCVFIAWLFTWYVTRYRYRRLINAYAKLAEGDYHVDMPDSPDTGSERVREAFVAMTSALAAARSRLAHADGQRRRLFADLAHELATPITSVLGIADALHEPDKFDAARREQLIAHLQHEAARLQRLSADVRDLAMLDDPDTRIERRAVDVAALARSAVDRAQVIAGARVTISCRAEPATCEADPLRIDQVLANLLSNAVRYTPDAGRVDVAVTCAAKSIELTVEDSGAGVPDEVLPRLGERLLRVDPSRDRKTGGHGLGLSIVAAVVERHDGKLAFGRAALGGLRVVVRLPA